MLKSDPFFWPMAVFRLLGARGAFVRQTAQTDCGVASALTVMNLMRRPADPVHAVDVMNADRTGTSLDDLRHYFTDTQGIDARALSVPADLVGQIGGLAILHMRQKHYVVLLRASRRGVLVFDPAVGPVYYPRADFQSLYSGHLLEVTPPGDGAHLPAIRQEIPRLVGVTPRRGLEPVALFVIGSAMRLLECALLLCVVAILFLVLNRASFPSLLMAFGLVVICGGLLLFARQSRFDGEGGWIRRQQMQVWRDLLRITLRGRDLNGFRGRYERDVASSLRQGLIVTIPQRAQLPATLGANVTIPVLLCLLSPIMALLHLTIFLAALTLAHLDSVQVCQRSVRKGIGRYSGLRQGNAVLSTLGEPEILGEVAKWMLIGFAGFSVLLNGLPPVALMFWILIAMQIVPLDFRRLSTLTPVIATQEPVSALTGAEVPLRRQRVLAEPDLTVTCSEGMTHIDGIEPLTATLRQPDLTVREQRLIMADVVRLAVEALPEEDRPQMGPVRIFGPGQDASLADFEHLMLAREARPGTTLPAPQETRKTLDMATDDPVLRDLHSCEPRDFPVFWDVRERMSVVDLQSRLRRTGVRRAGYLTMKRLTVVEAA